MTNGKLEMENGKWKMDPLSGEKKAARDSFLAALLTLLMQALISTS
jgi:hypothetical protein